jgi:hypothetical protein
METDSAMYAPETTRESAPSSYPSPTGTPWGPPAQPPFGPVPSPSVPPSGSRTKAVALSVAGVLVAGAAYAGWTIWRQDRADDLAQSITDQVLDDDESNVFNLAVGDCLSALPAGGEVSEVPTVACSEPHVYEVYFATDLPDSAYPGEPALIGTADQQCLAAFEPFAGIDYSQSLLFYSYLYPTQESWESAGDRSVLCLVFDSSMTTTTGTLAGAAR